MYWWEADKLTSSASEILSDETAPYHLNKNPMTFPIKQLTNKITQIFSSSKLGHKTPNSGDSIQMQQQMKTEQYKIIEQSNNQN